MIITGYLWHSTMIAMFNPRVFFSYSHDSETHRDAVLQLAQQLRGWGVDVQLDRFVPAPPEGWPRWMMAQVEAADFVILICTANYRRRFEGQEAPGEGKGVTFEGLLAIQHLYNTSTCNTRFIPAAFEGTTDTDIPLVLRPYTRYTLPSQFEALYRHITYQPEVVAAPLGPRKVLQSGGPIIPAPTSTTPGDGRVRRSSELPRGKIKITYHCENSEQSETKLPYKPLFMGALTSTSKVSLMPVCSEGGIDARIEPIELIYRLLLSLFTSGEQFRQWVFFWPEGDSLIADFPSATASASTQILGGLDVLRRHGHVDAEFFARLIAKFSRRHDDITRAALAWDGDRAGAK